MRKEALLIQIAEISNLKLLPWLPPRELTSDNLSLAEMPKPDLADLTSHLFVLHGLQSQPLHSKFGAEQAEPTKVIYSPEILTESTPKRFHLQNFSWNNKRAQKSRKLGFSRTLQAQFVAWAHPRDARQHSEASGARADSFGGQEKRWFCFEEANLQNSRGWEDDRNYFVGDF